MKSRTLTCIAAVTLFAALALPLRLAAKEHHSKKPPRYTVIDLGTLAGTFSEAVGINNRGSVSGYSTLPGDSVNLRLLFLIPSYRAL